MHTTPINKIAMSIEKIDNITKQLSQIRIRRENAIRALEAANEQESRLLRRLQRVRSVARPSEKNNPHKLGDKVRITNKLRDELGIIGIVTSNSTVRSRLIEIRNTTINRKYTRAWWNFEAISNEAQ